MKSSYISKHLLLASVLILGVSACSKDLSNNTAPPKVVEQSRVAEPAVDIADIDDMTEAEETAWFERNTDDGKITLQIGEQKFRLEYADSSEERALGLMYRRSLCEDCGMLFKFTNSRVGSIWMKNTFIPLDLAYISKEGEIVDIVQLKPHDLTPVKSSLLVLYALEMNEGWFAKQDVRVGDTISLLP